MKLLVFSLSESLFEIKCNAQLNEPLVFKFVPIDSFEWITN